jgi:hypothetical protein
MATPAPACKKALVDATLQWPKRDRGGDGIMGDDAHQKRKSDHNDGNAFDLTHDPANGPDCNILSREVIHDPRVTYVIWNRQIYSKEKAGEGWRAYTGSNPHNHHMHVSIQETSRNDLSPWPWTPASSGGLTSSGTPNNVILNAEYTFADVRYIINSSVSYDAGPSFADYPRKVLLPVGRILARLDPAQIFGIFNKVWWMDREEFRKLMLLADETDTPLRTVWQQSQAMPKLNRGVRTDITEIELTRPVFAWHGAASPLFNKVGGAEQYYLPNLSRATGGGRSDFARVLATYTLSA